MTRHLMAFCIATALVVGVVSGAVWRIQAQERNSTPPTLTQKDLNDELDFQVPRDGVQPRRATPDQPELRPGLRPGQPGGMMPGQPGLGPQGMGFGQPMGGAQMVASGNYVYILRGNVLYQYAADSLRLMKQARLPDPEGARALRAPVEGPRDNNIDPQK